MKKDKSGEWYLDKPQSDDDDEDEIATAGLVNSLKSKVPPSIRNTSSLAKRPRVVSGLGSLKSTAFAGCQSGGDAGNASANNFPGALGDKINVPASVRTVLRPHQREGIAFLWNCVTGVSPGLKNAFLKSAEEGGGSRSGSSSFDESDDDEGDLNAKAGASKGEVQVPRGAVLADEMGEFVVYSKSTTIFSPS